MTHRQTFTTLLDQISESLKAMAVEGWRGFDCSPGTLERVARLDQITRPPAESLEAIQSTTKEAISESIRISDTRFKLTAALLAALIGLILILGIIVIIRLPG